MTWKKKKVYQCILCKTEKVEEIVCYPEGKMKYPPHGWEGDFSKNGTCLCDRCSQNLRELAMYSDDCR